MVVKRLFDILFSATTLLLLAPVMVLVAIGIRLASPGPIFYRAKRAGLNGVPFMMHKFRTMHTVQPGRASQITAVNDARVYPFGGLLRKAKLDELPQLFDVLRGRMSIVGPRPEALDIVKMHYSQDDWLTLSVKPGLASPGSIYYYTHAEDLVGQDAPEEAYRRKVLPVKLAIERVYVRNASLLYDVRIILRTIAVILARMFGKRVFREPPELSDSEVRIDHRK